MVGIIETTVITSSGTSRKTTRSIFLYLVDETSQNLCNVSLTVTNLIVGYIGYEFEQ
jgi:hypothetical protein